PPDETFLEPELPLWPGPDLGWGSPESDVDELSQWYMDQGDPLFPSAAELALLPWPDSEAESAPTSESGSAHDLRAAVANELDALHEALDSTEAVTSSDPGEETAASNTHARKNSSREPAARWDASAVYAALAAADHHQPSLRDIPEWQDIQTVRAAAHDLWEAIKRQTGSHFKELLDKLPFQEWWKQTSIKICERISDLALRIADRLRTDAPEPAASMDRLHGAADAYSRPNPSSPDARPEPPAQINKLGEGLAAAQVKVNAARSRSTTVRRPRAPRQSTADRPGHLARTQAEPRRPRQGR
ncbi:hypothetical protein ACPXCP_39000, partial [Streptomyces sp. DT20]|uniref:hypothetical protein n=1 Tax=Streptomyces sp. DT20 TaxID=3416519 RepID=UPI003CEF2458